MDEEVYRQLALIEDSHWWFVGRRKIVSRLLRDLRLPPRARILEIGCGTGGNTEMLRNFGDVVSVEPNATARSLAREKGQTNILDGALPDDMPNDLGQFDVAVALDVLEHIDDDRASIRALKDHLKPGGFCVFSVPAFAFLCSNHDRTHHHKRRYGKRGLTEAVQASGLVPMTISYFNFLLFPIVVLVRIIKSLTGDTGRDDVLPSRQVNAVLAAIITSESHLIGRIPGACRLFASHAGQKAFALSRFPIRTGLTGTEGLRWAVAAIGLVCLATMAWRLIDGTGGDNMYFLPRMLDSYLFQKVNGLALEEYTASFCAGSFVFANPQSVSLSLAQVVLFALDPVVSIRLTYVVFAALGGVGMYLASRKLDLESDAALVAAVAYAFSGYFVTRMVMGQVSFQPFALAPLTAWMMMQSIHRFGTTRRLAGAAFLLAFSFYSGVAALIPQMGAIIGFLTLVYALRHGAVIRAFVVLAVVAVLALIMAAPKVEAGMSVLANLPKNYYDLPGFTPWGLVRFLVEGFFLNPSAPELNEFLIGRTFGVGWQGFYFGMTPFVLILLVAPLVWPTGRRRLAADIAGNLGIVIFGLVYGLLSAVMNLKIPGWNEFLHSLPLLGQVNTMLRWPLLLIPLFALLAGRSITYWNLPAVARLLLAAGLVLGMTEFQLVVTPVGLQEVKTYNPDESSKLGR